MKTIGLSLAIILTLVSCNFALAKPKKQVSKLPEGVNLQTDINFSGSTLRGKYQTPTEALAKVEQEKALNDLLMPRMHFKDRLVKQR